MATATLANVSARPAVVRSQDASRLGAAIRSFFAGFRSAGVPHDTLQLAARLGPEQLKEVGGCQDPQTGLVYGSLR
ncbi:hypothetical protein ACFFJB_04345 [Camelimonas abortus]|uniref:Uncharacterized protein n=1 Tax=Camelimonas abortus TaxID=1017184 RepID=A0ABV7LFG1_9HYPH